MKKVVIPPHGPCGNGPRVDPARDQKLPVADRRSGIVDRNMHAGRIRQSLLAAIPEAGDIVSETCGGRSCAGRHRDAASEAVLRSMSRSFWFAPRQRGRRRASLMKSGVSTVIGTDSTPTNRIRTGRRIINKHKSRSPCEPNRNTANLTVEHVSGHNAGLSGPK